MSDDRHLLILTHKGNEPAARELWARFAPRLLAYARSIVGSGAEDVVQSVFLAILGRTRKELRGVEDPAAWLLVLTRRCALNHLRSTRRELSRREVVKARAAARTSAESANGESLDGALSALPRRLREVVVLRHIAGLTFDQVAVALGANRNTTAARYREAIRRLRDMLVTQEATPWLATGVATGSLS